MPFLSVLSAFYPISGQLIGSNKNKRLKRIFLNAVMANVKISLNS